MIVCCPHCGLRPDSRLGGEVYERMLMTRLPAHALEFEIGLPRSRAVAELPGWHVTALSPGRGLRWWVAPIAFVPFVVRLLRRARVDVLRGHSVLFVGPSLIAARFLARAPVPIVLHHHHLEPPAVWLQVLVLRRADAIVTGSEWSRRELVARGVPLERITVVPHGTQPRPSIRRRADAWPRGVRLLFLGRLIERKQPALAVETLAEVVRRGTDASLVVAGDGPLAGELERLAARLGVGDRIRFVSRVDEQEKWDLYAAADILLFPSRLEGFGLVSAEAQAMGTAVVVVAGTAAEETIDAGRTGYAAAGDARSFAAAVESLCANGAYKSFGRAAATWAQRFDWDAGAAAIAATYRAVLAVQPRTPT